MNIRKTKEYKKLTPYLATMIAEGVCEGEGASEKEQITAWQYIIDKSLDKQLQGFFGRTAQNLIDNGIIEARKH